MLWCLKKQSITNITPKDCLHCTKRKEIPDGRVSNNLSNGPE